MITSLWVEQRHIDEGVQGNQSNCAIARAITEAIRLPTIALPSIVRIFYAQELMQHYLAGNVDMREYWLKDSYAYNVSPALARWIGDFDRNKLSVPPLYLWDDGGRRLETNYIPPPIRRFDRQKKALDAAGKPNVFNAKPAQPAWQGKTKTHKTPKALKWSKYYVPVTNTVKAVPNPMHWKSGPH